MNYTQPVTSSPKRLLTGREGVNVSIRNIGTKTVYLSDTTDVNASSFPLFAGDVASWAQGIPCYATCASGDTTTLVLSDSLASTLGLGNVQLAANASVGLNPGSSVGVTGNVPVVGPQTSQTVMAGSTLNAVNINNDSSSGTVTSTVIAASTKTIELHGLIFTVNANAGGMTAALIRSDTGANLVAPISPTAAGIQTVTKDFAGVLLPPGVALQAVGTNAGFGNVIIISTDVNYNLLG